MPEGYRLAGLVGVGLGVGSPGRDGWDEPPDDLDSGAVVAMSIRVPRTNKLAQR